MITKENGIATISISLGAAKRSMTLMKVIAELFKEDGSDDETTKEIQEAVRTAQEALVAVMADIDSKKVETNLDLVNNMGPDELVELWQRSFDRKYFPECGEDEDGEDQGECEHIDYLCSGCPKTFRRWLMSPMEEEKEE